MTVSKKKMYEAMFLVDAAEAEEDWDGVESNIRKIFEKGEDEIVSLRKWDTRRLAYEIDNKSRGTYILCYFRADGGRIGEIERAVQLSERIMRVLILSADHISQEDIEKDTPAILDEKQRGAGEVGGSGAEEAGRAAAGSEEGLEAEATEVFEESAVDAEDAERQSEDEVSDDFESADKADVEKSGEAGE